ncbi:MAG: cupin domain-containing protein, partial [Actinomycetota bacterium]|nr:cupin domain-containing protein [Actinomycetota bacterium]
LLIGASSGSRAITHNVSYFPHGHAPGHVHDPEEEVFYVDEGTGEVWIAGVPYALGPGTTVHTPMGVEHNVHVTSELPMRIIGNFSPHVIPGRYPDLPPRSKDLPEPPQTEAAFVVRAAGGEAPWEPLVQTERMSVGLRLIDAGRSFHLDAGDTDLLLHVLSGSGRLRVTDATYRVRRSSVVLLVAGESASLEADGPIRALEVRGVGP